MRKGILLLALLALLPLCFAAGEPYQWQVWALVAVLASFVVLVIFYMLTYVTDTQQMRPIVTGEMFQVLITMVMIAAFMGVEGFSSEIIGPAFGSEFGAGAGMNQLDYAIAITQSVADWEWNVMKELDMNVASPLGTLSTLSGNCAFLGFGFTYNGCAGIGVPFSSMSLALRTMAASLLAVYGQLMLLNMGRNFFFALLLPVGLFLRAFHVTRGTGGLLMAVAVAFYFMYPIGVIVTKGMFDMALDQDPSLGGAINMPVFSAPARWGDMSAWDVPGDCNPFDMSFGYTRDAIKQVLNPELVNRLLYHFFVGGILNPALSLLIALSSVRALSRIFGTEVDVSALARVA